MTSDKEISVIVLILGTLTFLSMELAGFPGPTEAMSLAMKVAISLLIGVLGLYAIKILSMSLPPSIVDPIASRWSRLIR